MRRTRIALGIMTCAASAALIGGIVADSTRTAKLNQTARQLATFAFTPRQVLQIDANAVPIQPTDPIFMAEPSGTYQQVGEIQSGGRAAFYSNAPKIDPAQFELHAHQTQHSLAWLIQTILPPEKRKLVVEELSAVIHAKQDQIIEAIGPALDSAMARVGPELERALIQAIDERSAQLDQLATQWLQDARDGEVEQLLREICWPILRANATPLADEIGMEVWERVSLWSFGWRYLYDKTPVGGEALRAEWNRFVREEAMPILERHTDQILDVAVISARQSAADPRVRQAIRNQLEQLLQDPQFRTLVNDVLRQALFDNEKVRAALVEAIQAPEVLLAAQDVAQELEPALRKIGEIVFGSPQSGMTPQFTRVIRGYGLGKDRRWFLLQPADNPSTQNHHLQVRPAPMDLPYPLDFALRASA